MHKKPGLLRYMFVILFVVCSAFLLTTSQPIRNDYKAFDWQFTFVKSTPVHSSFSFISFKKPSVKNDHIRVRYMGGDCGYDPSSFVMKFAVPAFNNVVPNPDHRSFIFSSANLLFKLR